MNGSDVVMTGKVDILDDAPCPRSCFIKKWSGFDGYGFNLQGEKGRAGHFIGEVDPGSPAEAAGLKVGDRVVEVNRVNVEGEDHSQVVERIKFKPREAEFLVVDSAADEHYRKKNIVLTSNLPNVIKLWTPQKPISGSTMNPRFCCLKIWSDFVGYGFTIQADKDKLNPVVSEVDPDSPAENGGLSRGDKIVEVNGVLVQTDTPYQQLVDLIKFHPNNVKLLVIEKANYLKFISLRSENKYPDDKIEIIECREEFRQNGTDIAASADPNSSSLSSGRNENSKESQNHSTSNRQDFSTTTTTTTTITSSPSSWQEEVLQKNSSEVLTKDPDFGLQKVLGLNLKYCEVSSTARHLGFGFNLVAEKNKPGNYVDKVEDRSPSRLAGLEDGDYLVSVNDSLVVGDSHQEVVEKIKLVPTLVRLVVTDRDGFYDLHRMKRTDAQDLIEKTLGFKFNHSPSGLEGLLAEASVNEIESEEDDSFTIDYKQVAEEMVQLAMKEADQDKIKLEVLESGKNEFSTKSNNHIPNNNNNNCVDECMKSCDTTRSETTSQNFLPCELREPIVVAGLVFSATAAEARTKMKRKVNAKTCGLSAKDKYELLQKL